METFLPYNKISYGQYTIFYGTCQKQALFFKGKRAIIKDNYI